MQFIKCAAACAVAVAVSAGSVKADLVGPFEFSSTGMTTQTPTGFSFSTDIVDKTLDLGFQQFDAEIALDPLRSTTFTGTFVITAKDGSLSGDVAGTLSSVAGMFTTTSGKFFITDATGIFMGLTGDGVFNTFSNNKTGATQSKVGGTLIPAPGAIAAFAFAGLLRRRRRQSD